MENIFTSVKLSRSCANKKQVKSLALGVTRLNRRGIPSLVLHTEDKNEKIIESLIGTLKGAMLTGEDKTKNLLASSDHDTKPVYFLTNFLIETK